MKNFKIAFFIELNRIKDKLYNVNIELGNPGIGGTQYTFLLTVKYLNRIYGKNFATLITESEIDLCDKEIPIEIVDNCDSAISFCEKNCISTLVFNANFMDKISNDKLDTTIRLYFWAHNTLNWKKQCLAARKKSIDKIICVSKSQYENMEDTPCFNKCIFINNVIPSYFYNNANITDYSSPKVVYVGSIMPQKGVHNLLNIWKYVEKKVPNAQLYIFGGASVWNNDVKLGDLKIADIYYERIIQKKLKKIVHCENVHFMGAKGWNEITKLLNDTTVAVVNPSYYKRDETFCISAIELEAHGIPIVSRQRNDGLNSTIVSGTTGYLEKTDKLIAEKIVLLLSDNSLAPKLGKQAREYVKRFVVEEEIVKWKKLLDKSEKDNIMEDKNIRLKIKSHDARCLDYDLLLKIIYIIKSGKVFDLIKKRLFNK